MADIPLTIGTRARIYVRRTPWGPHTHLYIDGEEVKNIRSMSGEEIPPTKKGDKPTYKIEVEYFCELYGGRGTTEHFFVDSWTRESEYDRE